MSGFEYKVVPAPMRGLKAKGVKGTQARFANALQTVMNEHGAEGWEYQRTDTLPVEERQGLTGKTTSFQNMLVFRRAIDVTVDAPVAVAALIEDQSHALEQAEDNTTAVMPEAPVPEDATPDDAIAPQPVDADTARTLKADERVADALDAPFVFPWNKRAQADGAKDSSAPNAKANSQGTRSGDNLPAE